MAFIEDALKQILSDDADVSGYVGNRITPNQLSQNSIYPAVSFFSPDVSGREPVMGSKATTPPEARFVFSSCAKDASGGFSARRVASLVDKAVRHALQGYSGTVTVTALSPPETVVIQGIFFSAAANRYDDRTQTHEYASSFVITFSEEVPD